MEPSSLAAHRSAMTFGSLLTDSVGWLLLGAACAGTVYMVAAAIVLARFFARRTDAPRGEGPVSLLKPLHGSEPNLQANLSSFLAQNHGSIVQLICGVERADDAAIAAVEPLIASHPAGVVTLVVDGTSHGASGKVSNLTNMDRHALHSIVVISDSDMVACPRYLGEVTAALKLPDAGAVTLLYRGRGDAGFWSELGAAGLSYQFLPGAVFGVVTGLAQPCMGSTIALGRETLDRIGGFRRFADTLADDYAIGEAVRAIGLRVVVPPLLMTHASAERSFVELWRHEVRWGATVRSVVPGAYTASVIGMPLPLAILGAALVPAHAIGAVVALAALVARFAVVRVVDRQAGASTAPVWLLPFRDGLTFAVFIASFFAGSIDWRGNKLKMQKNGRIAAEAESLA